MRVEGASDPPAHIVTESQNISSSGVYCTSSHYLAPLSKVALTIVLPRLPGGRTAKELIKCEGIVVRCQQSVSRRDRTYELACMFSGLDEGRRAMLDQFVTWRNLQALRAATRASGGTRRERAPRPRAAAAAAGRSRPKAAARRRTVR